MLMRLLNPGPVTLTQRVREAMHREDLCHIEPEFAALQTEIRMRLASVYPEAENDFTSVLLTGSGTAAVEMMVGSLVPQNGCALVVANGVYGERMAAMLTAQGKTALLARSEWIEPMNLTATEEILAQCPAISCVLAVHHETTTGRLNDIPALGELCRKYDKPLLLDAVSSFGAEHIEFAEWNLAACASTANKCLHGVPGVSFVLVRKSILQSGKSGATCFYLDLFRHYEEQRKGSTLCTQSVQACYALAEAIQELEESGGQIPRYIHYLSLSHKIFVGLRELGIEPLLKSAAPSSVVLTAYLVPEGFTYAGLHDFLKERGFVIYGGQGKFDREIFRIAVMGDFDSNVADYLLDAFREFLNIR